MMGLAVLVVLSGCATLTQDELDQREWDRGQVYEGRALCQARIAADNGTWFVSYTGGRTKANETLVDVKADLWVNNCIPWLRQQGFDL